jgi:uncharacterized protein (TIGR01370 family)
MLAGLRAVFTGLALLSAALAAAAEAAPRSMALYYGVTPPWDELKAFDVVVVDPDHSGDAGAVRARQSARSSIFAYVSVGEVLSSRDYAKDIPAAWKVGENTAWGAIVLDQAQPGWPAFLAERIVKPIVDAGYAGLFLDTLDSYHLVAKDAAARARQEAGLVAAIMEIKRRYPGLKLIFNRGFEVLPQLKGAAYAVAAESLYRGWDPAAKTYREVPPNDREWLLGQLNRVKNEYRLPVIAIDYVPPADRELARATARRILEHGFIPYVADPALETLGISAVEAIPRKVLMLYRHGGDPAALAYESILRYAAMPLNWMGYVPEYLDVSTGQLPPYPLNGRYAGIVTWFEGDLGAAGTAYAQWLARQVEGGVKVAVFSDFGVPLVGNVARTLGLRTGATAAGLAQVSVESRAPAIGYEVDPPLDRRGFLPMAAEGGDAWLRLRNERGDRMDAVALTPWGGYALSPYVILSMPGQDSDERWLLDPFAFLQQALRLPAVPVPDVTTENGRRLMIAHIDGDGFPGRAELPGNAFAGEVMLKEVLERFRVPTTVSVIEGEVGPEGLFPKDSPQLEAIARRIFLLPNVEVASHTFSHPFRWQQAETAPNVGDYTLKIAGYTFSLQREIGGSIDYINRRLAPPGKPVRTFLWSGDANPSAEAVRLAYAAGVANLNGGETTITRSHPTLTRVAPIGIPKGGLFQVYAPVQNENLFTNLWTGPFGGFERVIETFQLTDAPRRLKPINLYYHMYSATKRASLTALDRVYRWALAQPVMPLYASEYAAKAVDFNSVSVARDLASGAWQIRGEGALRTLRLPSSLGTPDTGGAVAGYARINGDAYVHLTGGDARITVRSGSADGRGTPYLASSNARISEWRVTQEAGATRIAFAATGHMPAEFAFANAAGCALTADGRAVPRTEAAGLATFRLAQHGSPALLLRCGR